tara:strand:+ start:734 stop:1027 length:294 start_codon:yes stop_codon:yes gene_type:complete
MKQLFYYLIIGLIGIFSASAETLNERSPNILVITVDDLGWADVEYYQKKLASGMSHQNAIYAAMVHSLDENIGRLMAKLDELKLTESQVLYPGRKIN